MIVGIYVRVSTAEQAKEGYSIGEQTERLQKYCEAHDWKIYKVYTDAGYSGKDTKRPALQELIRDVKAGKFDVVLVYKLDRLSRSQKDTLMLIEDIFLSNNTDFISMQENFDTSSPFGRAMIGILAVFAQLEREQIKERMKMGKDARAKEGKYSGGAHPPYGYDYIDGELIINDFEAMIVKDIFNMAFSGKSTYAITNCLQEKGYKTKNGRWGETTVRRILSNKTYIGFVRYRDEWFPGLHKPIISEELFNNVQKELQSRSEKFNADKHITGKATSYLGGLLVCGCCGGKYHKNTSITPKNGKRYVHRYYACINRTMRKSVRKMRGVDIHCTNKNWNMELLDQLIFGQISQLLMDPGFYDEVKRQPDEKNDIVLYKEIKKLDMQISRLMDLYAVGNMPMDLLEQKIKEIDDQKSRYWDEIHDIEKKRDLLIDQEELKRKAKDFPDIIARGNIQEIRSVISDLIDKIVITGEDIDIHWNF